MQSKRTYQMLKPSNFHWKNISQKLFEYYVYLCVIWVHLALAFEIYMIVKHFNEL